MEIRENEWVLIESRGVAVKGIVTNKEETDEGLDVEIEDAQGNTYRWREHYDGGTIITLFVPK